MHTLHASNSLLASPDALSDLLKRWRTLVDADLKGAPFDKKLVTRTLEGIALQPLYTRADADQNGDASSLPGKAPFVRGSRAGGYAQRPWEVAQAIAATSPTEFNAALRGDLMRGQNAVVLDSPALLSDLAALRQALEGVDLSAIPIHVFADANALPSAALLLSLAAERRCDWSRLTGGVTADPLNTWVVESKLPLGLDRELDALAGWTRWAANHAPNLRTISVNGRAWAETGGTAVQELAFALAAGAEYLRALNDRGISIDTAARRMEFLFSSGPQFFTEIAKLRAWRGLWTRVVVAYGAKPEVAASSHINVATSRWNKTLLDPHVNMLRVTTEALSAVLGGCDSLHIAPFDEVTGATSDFSRRVARNVHTIVAEEFGFAATADPAGGSWYLENLTDQVARKAWELFQRIAAEGGFSEALRDGIPQSIVSEAAVEKAEAVGKRRLTLIGTNVFPNLKEKPLAPQFASPATVTEAPIALPKLAPGATWPERFEAALVAARHGASAEQLAKLSGAKTRKSELIATISPFRISMGFELLRAASDAYAAKHGQRPRVFLAKMGPSVQHKARADFSAGFFAVGGFEVMAKQAFDSPDAAARAAIESGAPVAVLCSTDESYGELVPAFATAVKAAQRGIKVVLAGLPTDPVTTDAYRKAGIDEFIHLRANVHAVLAKILKQIGAIA
jgi:methylmalonyl-CoA mutase